MGDDIYPSRAFSNTELRLSKWFIEHKHVIKKVLLGLLIFLDVLLIVGSFTAWITYAFTFSSERLRIGAISDELIDWKHLRPLIQSQPLAIETVAVIPSGGTTDFVARVTNPNRNRWADSIRYRFVWDGGESEWYTSFIFPNETKHFIALGVEALHPNNVRLEVMMGAWQRFTSALEETVAMQREIVVTSSRFISRGYGDGVDLDVSRIVFDVENRTPFRLRKIQFKVFVTSGTSYRAANVVTILNLEPDSTRTVEARWFEGAPLFGAPTLLIEPEINFFDKDQIFFKIGSYS